MSAHFAGRVYSYKKVQDVGRYPYLSGSIRLSVALSAAPVDAVYDSPQNCHIHHLWNKRSPAAILRLPTERQDLDNAANVDEYIKAKQACKNNRSVLCLLSQECCLQTCDVGNAFQNCALVSKEHSSRQ